MEIFNFPLDRIKTSKNNPRKYFDKDALKELVASIQTTGLINPITVKRLENGYEIVAGERRFRAFKELKAETIPCIVTKSSNASVISVAENMMREDLSLIEESMGVKKLFDNGLTTRRVSELLGRSVQWVARRAAIADISEDAMQYMIEQQWSDNAIEKITLVPAELQSTFVKNLPWQVANNLDTLEKFIHEKLLHKLDKTPFDIEKAGCAKCPNRTDALNDLFGLKDKDASCTLPACYHKHTMDARKERLEQLREKNGKALVVASTHGYELEGEKVQRTWDYEKAKKADKGSILAFDIATGNILYLKSKKGAKEGDKPVATEKKSLVQKAEQLKSLRQRMIIADCIKLIEEGAVALRKGPEQKLNKLRIVLFAGFNGKTKLDKDSNNDQLVDAMFEACMRNFIREIKQRMMMKREEAALELCNLFDIDFEKLAVQANNIKQIPKGWVFPPNEKKAIEKALSYSPIISNQEKK